MFVNICIYKKCVTILIVKHCIHFVNLIESAHCSKGEQPEDFYEAAFWVSMLQYVYKLSIFVNFFFKLSVNR